MRPNRIHICNSFKLDFHLRKIIISLPKYTDMIMNISTSSCWQNISYIANNSFIVPLPWLHHHFIIILWPKSVILLSSRYLTNTSPKHYHIITEIPSFSTIHPLQSHHKNITYFIPIYALSALE